MNSLQIWVIGGCAPSWLYNNLRCFSQTSVGRGGTFYWVMWCAGLLARMSYNVGCIMASLSMQNRFGGREYFLAKSLFPSAQHTSVQFVLSSGVNTNCIVFRDIHSDNKPYCSVLSCIIWSYIAEQFDEDYWSKLSKAAWVLLPLGGEDWNCPLLFCKVLCSPCSNRHNLEEQR